MTKAKFLFSGTGLLSVAVSLLIAVGLISAFPSVRIDLTEDELFSLADGTRNIVSGLEEPIELIFFYSESATEDQPQIRSYGTRVQELLREIVIASNGNLSLRIVDPEPFSEEEDLATQYGVQPVPVTQGGPGIYFGLVAAQLDNDPALQVSETMPLIRPDQEQFLRIRVYEAGYPRSESRSTGYRLAYDARHRRRFRSYDGAGDTAVDDYRFHSSAL